MRGNMVRSGEFGWTEEGWGPPIPDEWRYLSSPSWFEGEAVHEV